MASLSMSPDLASLFDLNGTIGAAFFGMVVSSILFGVSNLQLYIYYQQFPNDWIIYRTFVALLWALDAFNLALSIHAVYFYSIPNFGNYLALDSVVWSFKLQTATNVIIVVVIQGLYSLRLWKLNYRRTLLPRLVPIIIVLGAGVGIALIIETYKLDLFTELDNMAWATYSSFATVAAIDFTIAGTMCYYLRGTRSDFQSTNSRISTLILWTMSTGLVTSFCSLASLVTYAAMPQKLVFVAIEFLLTKLYFNSFLAMLNARKGIREKGTDECSVNVSNQRSPAISAPRGMPFSNSDKTSFPLDNLGGSGYDLIKMQNSFISTHHENLASKPEQDSQYGDAESQSVIVHAV